MTVARHINGIVLNPLEYLFDDKGECMVFRNKKEAVAYLRAKGLSDEVINAFIFED
jgi:hypothetical protein